MSADGAWQAINFTRDGSSEKREIEAERQERPLQSAKKTAVKDGSCSSVVGRVGERFGGGGGRGADGESKKGIGSGKVTPLRRSEEFNMQ